MKLQQVNEAKYHKEGYNEKTYQEAIRLLAEQIAYMARDDYLPEDGYSSQDVLDYALEYAETTYDDLAVEIRKLLEPKKKPKKKTQSLYHNDPPRRVRR